MLIVCPTCATTYEIKLAALGAAGRTVRCASCKNTWFATPESAIETPEPALAAAPSTPRASAAPPDAPQPEPPSADDFTEETASNFAVETIAEGADAQVVDSPPLVPQDHADDQAQKFDPGAPEDIESLAARRKRHASAARKEPRTLVQRIFSVPMLIIVLLAVVIAALQSRVALVRQFPQTASLFAMIGMPVNLRGLSFMDVKSRSEFVDGAMVLVVEGTIVNLTIKTQEIPRLRFSLRNASGHEVYAWTALPSKTLLGSGDGLAFRTRLASPPPDGRDVIVRFFSRRDAGTGS